MADLANLTIKIDSSGVATATRDLNDLEKNSRKVESATQSMSGGFEKLRGIVAALGASYAMLRLEELAKESALLAARVETLGVVMGVVGRNANYSAIEMQKYADKVKALGITTQESQQTVIRFAQANLDLEKSAKLARVAQDAAVIGNTNSSEALKGLMHGIATLQPEVLRTYGIIVNFESEYAKFAAAAGRTTESLSGQEKQMIALNAVLKAGEGITGSYQAAMGTVGKQITSLPRLIEETKLQFGELFKPALTVLVKEFSVVLNDVSKYITELEKSGQLSEWSSQFASGLKAAIQETREFITTTKNVIETIGPFLVEAGKLAALGFVAEKVAMLAVNIGRLGAVIKANKEILVFLAAYEASSTFAAWVDGTNDVINETERLGRVLKEQKRQLAEETKKADAQSETRRNYEAAYTEQYDKEIRAAINAERDKNAQIEQERLKAMKQQQEKDTEALKKWETEKVTIGKSGLEKDKALLEAEYRQYDRVVKDKVALEKWFSEEKKAIKIKEMNEIIALDEELFAATGQQKYADAAIEAMRVILDAEEKKWAEILQNDDDAHILRLKREQEYADKVKGVIREIVTAEREAVSEVSGEATSGGSPSLRVIQGGGGGNVGEYTGMPVGPGSGYTVYNVGGSVFYNLGQAQEYARSLEAIAKNTADAALQAAAETASAAKQAAQEAAQKAKELADQFVAMSITILEMEGRTEESLTAKRLLELSKLDASLHPLQRRIYYLEDEAKATEKAAAAQEALAKRQDDAVTLWKTSLSQIVSAGQAISSFLRGLSGGGNAATSNYLADLASARGGDFDAYSRITQSAGEYINQATKSAGSSQDVQRAIARVRSDLSGLSPVTQLDRNLEALNSIRKATEDTAKATSNLDVLGIKTIFDLTSVITFVSNADGIPADLRTLVTNQTKDYLVFLKVQLDSSVSDDLKRVLIDASGKYTATVAAIAGDIDNESRALAITRSGFYTATVNSVMGSFMDKESQKLAITAAGAYVATVETALGIVDADSRKLALTSIGTYETTVNAAIGTMDTVTRKIALETTNTLLTTVDAAIGTVDGDTRKIATVSTNKLKTTVDAILGVVNDETKALAVNTSNILKTEVNADFASTLPDEVKRLALGSTNKIAATVSAVLDAGINTDAKKLAINTLNTIATTVTASLGTVNLTAQNLGLKTGNTLASIVTASLGTVNDDAKALGLNTANTLATIVTASLGELSDPDAKSLASKTANDIAAKVTAALGSGDAQALKLATETANTFKATVEAAMATDASSQQLAKLLQGSGVTTALTASGSLVWDPDNQLKSIFDAISANTALTAANTGRYTTLRQRGANEYSYDIYGGDNKLVNVVDFSVSPYLTKEQSLAYIETLRPRGFAEGGTFEGGWRVVGEKGAELEFTGPSTIFSTEKSKSLVDNTSIVEEVRQLRLEVRTGNVQLAKNTGSIAKILTRFDDDGMPAERVA